MNTYVKPSCAPGAFDNGSACVAKLVYTKKTVVIVGGYPWLVGNDGVPVEARNDTGFTVGGIPIWGCSLTDLPLPSGLVIYLCRITGNGSDFSLLTHNVLTNALTRYTGAMPSGLEFAKNADGTWTISSNWHQCMRACAELGEWGGPAPYENMYYWAEAASGGYYFSDGKDASYLWHRDAAGVMTLKYHFIKWQVIVMATYSSQ